MKNTITFLLLVATMAIFSCKEKETPEPEIQLPAITSKGLNTFGCVVNGEIFVAGRGKEKAWNPTIISYMHYKDSIFSLLAKDYESNKVISLETIYYSGDKNVSLYNPNSYDYASITEFIDFNFFGGKQYLIQRTNDWRLHISEDNDRFISGTFSFDAINREGGDTIHIRDGRFDVLKKVP